MSKEIIKNEQRYGKGRKSHDKKATRNEFAHSKSRERLEAIGTFIIATVVFGTLFMVLEIMATMLKTGVCAWSNSSLETVDYVHMFLKNARPLHIVLQGMVLAVCFFLGCSRDDSTPRKKYFERVPKGARGIVFCLSFATFFEVVNVLAFLVEFCMSAVIAGVTSIMPTVEVTNIIRLSLLAEQFDPLMRILEGFILLSIRGMFKQLRS